MGMFRRCCCQCVAGFFLRLIEMGGDGFPSSLVMVSCSVVRMRVRSNRARALSLIQGRC